MRGCYRACSNFAKTVSAGLAARNELDRSVTFKNMAPKRNRDPKNKTAKKDGKRLKHQDTGAAATRGKADSKCCVCEEKGYARNLLRCCLPACPGLVHKDCIENERKSDGNICTIIKRNRKNEVTKLRCPDCSKNLGGKCGTAPPHKFHVGDKVMTKWASSGEDDDEEYASHIKKLRGHIEGVPRYDVEHIEDRTEVTLMEPDIRAWKEGDSDAGHRSDGEDDEEFNADGNNSDDEDDSDDEDGDKGHSDDDSDDGDQATNPKVTRALSCTARRPHTRIWYQEQAKGKATKTTKAAAARRRNAANTKNADAAQRAQKTETATLQKKLSAARATIKLMNQNFKCAVIPITNTLTKNITQMIDMTKRISSAAGELQKTLMASEVSFNCPSIPSQSPHPPASVPLFTSSPVCSYIPPPPFLYRPPRIALLSSVT